MTGGQSLDVRLNERHSRWIVGQAGQIRLWIVQGASCGHDSGCRINQVHDRPPQ